MQLAFGLLTYTPFTPPINDEAYTEDNRRKAVSYYGLVGAILGLLLAVAAAIIFAVFPAAVAAILVLALWVLLTGAMHLDGLADCSDAAAAGHAIPEKRLAVMKTPEVGAIAVVVLCVHLLLKASLLYSLYLNLSLFQFSLSLIAATFLSRQFTSIYMSLTPYARKKGLAVTLEGDAIINKVWPLLIGLVVLVFSVPFVVAVLLFVVCAVFLYFWRKFWLIRVGGYTGDCAGAFIELSESLVLLLFVGMLNS